MADESYACDHCPSGSRQALAAIPEVSDGLEQFTVDLGHNGVDLGMLCQIQWFTTVPLQCLYGVELKSELMGWTPPPEAASMCQSGSAKATT